MDREKLIAYLNKGSQIIGGVTGGAISLIGPEGPVIGGGAGIIVTNGLLAMTERFLGDRESIRIGAASSYCLVKIKEKLDSGAKLRRDTFLYTKEGRTSAEELFEGVLLKSKNSYQEKKIKYIANIFANTAFNQNVSFDNANQVVILSENLSYRKICIIAMLENEKRYEGYKLRSSSYLPEGEYEPYDESLNWEMITQDFKDLCDIGLVHNEQNMMTHKVFTIPASMRLTEVGQSLAILMGLSEMPEEEFTDLQRTLR